MIHRSVGMAGMLLMLTTCGASHARGAQPTPELDYLRFTVAGTVREEATGRPMEGILVRLAGAHPPRYAATDSAGRYRFEGLEDGSYTIEAARPGFYTERRDISYVGNDWTCIQCPLREHTLDFHMRPHVLPLEG